MRSVDEVSNLINCLSNDEDVRQELWVYYLSDKPVESLEARLVRIKAEHDEDQELQKAIWQLVNDPPSEELSTLIQNNFTEYEKSVICCLLLGLDSGKISTIKGISQVRIKQSLHTIRYNPCWSKFYERVHKVPTNKRIK